MILAFKFNILASFGLSDSGVIHSMDWCLCLDNTESKFCCGWLQY